jgi:hypothetical protein
MGLENILPKKERKRNHPASRSPLTTKRINNIHNKCRAAHRIKKRASSIRLLHPKLDQRLFLRVVRSSSPLEYVLLVLDDACD